MSAGTQQLVDRLSERAGRARVPLYGSAELTWRCNFRCVHCYQEGLRESHRELSTAEWKRLFDELADMGCLFLTLTGGDPLLRSDFAELYAHVHRRGFLPTVFTNGVLLDEGLLELFEAMPPKQIEITLYGASEAAYARVTGRGDWYPRVVGAVDALLARGLRLELKAQAMRPMLGELDALANFARARGLRLRTDGSIFPRLDGNRAPLEHRLAPEELVALESLKPGFDDQIQACFAGAPADLGDRVYRCGAATYSFNVDPSGTLSPCVISRGASRSARDLGAALAWRGLEAEGERQHVRGDGCGSCGARGGCSRCPGLSWMERGDVEARVDHHCGVTAVKLRILGKAA
ncbi:MAG: radical SAM protein [Myxococcales bacterium]